MVDAEGLGRSSVEADWHEEGEVAVARKIAVLLTAFGATAPACLPFRAFHVHLTIPADANQFGEAAGIALAAFVHPHRKSRLRMPGINADDRQPDPCELVPEPPDMAPVSNPMRSA